MKGSVLLVFRRKILTKLGKPYNSRVCRVTPSRWTSTNPLEFRDIADKINGAKFHVNR